MCCQEWQQKTDYNEPRWNMSKTEAQQTQVVTDTKCCPMLTGAPPNPNLCHGQMTVTVSCRCCCLSVINQPWFRLSCFMHKIHWDWKVIATSHFWSAYQENAIWLNAYSLEGAGLLIEPLPTVNRDTKNLKQVDRRIVLKLKENISKNAGGNSPQWLKLNPRNICLNNQI